MQPVEILKDLFFFQRGYLNANHFALRGSDPVLIDTAYVGGFAETKRLIQAIGIDPVDIRLIVSTHTHCDHIGGNHRFQETSGMSWGDWEGEILKPLRKRLGDEMRDNERRGIDFCPPGGESPRQVQARLKPWLRQVAESKQDAAAVVHKGIIRCIYALACNWDMCGDSPVDFAWDSLHQFELSADGKLLDSYQSIPLIKS